MTELSFLIELLLNHDLKKETKDALAARIRAVEETLTQAPVLRIPYVAPSGPQQAASTLALMAKHGDLPKIVPVEMPPIEQVAHIAQTPATAAAMNSRNSAIAESIAGKIDKQTGRPRKF